MKHECAKDVHKVTGIFFANNTWWMELGFGSTAIEYCPFCGAELRKLEKKETKKEEWYWGPKDEEHWKEMLEELRKEKT